MNGFNKFWYSNSISSKLISGALFPLSLMWILIDRIKYIMIKPYNPKIKLIEGLKLTYNSFSKMN